MSGKDNSSKYDDFVTNYFAWLSLKDQKEIANKLANITEEKEKKGK